MFRRCVFTVFDESQSSRATFDTESPSRRRVEHPLLGLAELLAEKPFVSSTLVERVVRRLVELLEHPDVGKLVELCARLESASWRPAHPRRDVAPPRGGESACACQYDGLSDPASSTARSRCSDGGVQVGPAHQGTSEREMRVGGR